MTDFIEFPTNSISGFIRNLSSNTPPKLGTMTAQHMLEHLLLVMKLSRGKFNVSVVTPEEKIEKVKRIMLLSDLPLKRDFAAPFLPPGLQPLKFDSIEKAKNFLIKEIDIYLDYWKNNSESKFNHPIFGQLNMEEWHLFHRKHFTHHFSQFHLV